MLTSSCLKRVQLFKTPFAAFSSKPKPYDFIVIGGGSGGMGAGRKAAALGKNVAMIENKKLGGTCVNVGCVPKKVMLNLASYIEDGPLFRDYGVRGTDDMRIDFKHFKEQRDGYVKRLNDIYANNIKNSDIDLFKGTAAFVDKNTVKTSEGELLTADHIIIASGSEPNLPKFPGYEHCWTSDDVFTMEELPESIVVLGGGYIGVEMSQIFQGLGVKTTVVNLGEKLFQGLVDG